MTANTEASNKTAKDRAYSRTEVAEIIRSVLGKIDEHKDPTAALHTELTQLVSYIESMRAELAQLRSIEISHNHIPAASDELDAVVEETARATGEIMDACDHIQNEVDDIENEATKDKVTDAITAIYEACSFQDITGQRITKVVKTLKNIEAKIAEIMDAFENVEGDKIKPIKDEKVGDEKLLNGPQLSGGGASQEEIDALLASFD